MRILNEIMANERAVETLVSGLTVALVVRVEVVMNFVHLVSRISTHRFVCAYVFPFSHHCDYCHYYQYVGFKLQ